METLYNYTDSLQLVGISFSVVKYPYNHRLIFIPRVTSSLSRLILTILCFFPLYIYRNQQYFNTLFRRLFSLRFFFFIKSNFLGSDKTTKVDVKFVRMYTCIENIRDVYILFSMRKQLLFIELYIDLTKLTHCLTQSTILKFFFYFDFTLNLVSRATTDSRVKSFLRASLWLLLIYILILNNYKKKKKSLRE